MTCISPLTIQARKLPIKSPNKTTSHNPTNSLQLPIELGKCQYEKGADGQMLSYLTSPDLMSVHLLDTEWSATGILDIIAASNQYHALIDSGALITGMSNLEGMWVCLRAKGIFPSWRRLSESATSPWGRSPRGRRRTRSLGRATHCHSLTGRTMHMRLPSDSS